MKYIAVLDTDDFEDFEFFEDGKEKYLHAVDVNAENGEWIYLPFKPLEQELVIDKIRAEIEPKCDRINSLASVLPYTAHREIQELLCEIIDLCKAESEIDNGND
jgi:hypothetical protein